MCFCWFKVGRAHRARDMVHVGAHRRSYLTASKEMETSVIKPQEPSSASEQNELSIGFFSRASRELSSVNTLISVL